MIALCLALAIGAYAALAVVTAVALVAFGESGPGSSRYDVALLALGWPLVVYAAAPILYLDWRESKNAREVGTT